ncbi:Protein abhd14a [Desmophyllum pertusum]|uniref:Protein ABHD14A n=1 Tax=Desmophyllum pertusum TaxID=174260 RepID=A0A9W9YX17_9CNID|nr:Protein abhd14a [Desmophyllum pertusum]
MQCRKVSWECTTDITQEDAKYPSSSRGCKVCRLHAFWKSFSPGFSLQDQLESSYWCLSGFRYSFAILFVNAEGNGVTWLSRMEGEANGIFYREEVPANGGRFTVLFLHGQAFSSQTWEDLGTLKFLRSKNYRVVALDLPGYVKSKDAKVPRNSEERRVFLNKFTEKLQITRPVIVSPSMSGSYALPFIFQGDQGRNLRGFVPVAPVGTDQHSESDYKNLQLPTLIVYGENDATLGVSSLRRLRNIPGSVIHMIKGAGHACYMKNADEFHENLDNFLSKLQE